MTKRMQTSLWLSLLGALLLLASCRAVAPASTASSAISAEGHKLFGQSAAITSQVRSDGSVDIEADLSRAATQPPSYALLASVYQAYPHAPRIGLSLRWTDDSGQPVDATYTWEPGSFQAHPAAIVYRAQLDTSPPERWVWVSHDTTLQPSTMTTDTPTLRLLSRIVPTGGDVHGWAPQVLIVDATLSWMRDVGAGRIKPPDYPAPEREITP